MLLHPILNLFPIQLSTTMTHNLFMKLSLKLTPQYTGIYTDIYLLHAQEAVGTCVYWQPKLHLKLSVEDQSLVSDRLLYSDCLLYLDCSAHSGRLMYFADLLTYSVLSPCDAAYTKGKGFSDSYKNTIFFLTILHLTSVNLFSC